MRVVHGHAHPTGAALCVLLLASLSTAAARQAQTVTAERSTSQSSSTRPAPARTPPNQTRRATHTTTLAEYRARVRGAFASLEELAALYERAGAAAEAESDAAAVPEQRKRAVLDRVRGQLPPRERVEWGGEFIEVDNSWLHETLDESERAGDDAKRAGDDAKRADGLRAAAARLRSLEARLAETEGGAGAATDRDAERGRLNAILRTPEFTRDARRQQGGALRRLVEQFIEWLSSLFPEGPTVRPGASPRISLLAQVLVGALCLAVLAYVARLLWLRRGLEVKSLRLKRGARVVLGEQLEADKTASDLLDDAERLARAGDLRGAIRKAYVALLCELGDRGIVRLERHKTNRDYLNAVRRAARPRLYTELLPLTFDFEVHWYGLRDASDADWQSFKTRCRQVLRESGVRSQ